MSLCIYLDYKIDKAVLYFFYILYFFYLSLNKSNFVSFLEVLNVEFIYLLRLLTCVCVVQAMI